MGLTYFYYLSNQANLDSINAIPLWRNTLRSRPHCKSSLFNIAVVFEVGAKRYGCGEAHPRKVGAG